MTFESFLAGEAVAVLRDRLEVVVGVLSFFFEVEVCFAEAVEFDDAGVRRLLDVAGVAGEDFVAEAGDLDVADFAFDRA